MSDELKKQLETKDDMIKALQEQISTIKDSIKLKDDQVETLKSSMDFKNEKIEALEKTLQLKEEQLKSGSGGSADTVLIDELKKEIDLLNEELGKADEEIERLELTTVKSESSGSSNSKIIDFTSINMPKDEIIEKMRSILESSLHNVMINVPMISDLQDLHLYEVRSSVNLKISCLINPGDEEHADLLEEFESLDNISLRTFASEDRYLLLRDGEELLLAVAGINENNHLIFHTRDEKHIKLFNSLAMEGWLRGRKI